MSVSSSSMRVQTRDQAAEMLVKCMGGICIQLRERKSDKRAVEWRGSVGSRPVSWSAKTRS